MQDYTLHQTGYKKASVPNKWVGTTIILSLALITRILQFFAAHNPILVENLYSSTIYPYIAKVLGFISNFAPFSIAEGFLIFVVLLIVAMPLTIILKPKLLLNNVQIIFHFLVRLSAVMYILFYFLWGFNYYRQDYSIIGSMNEASATYDDLKILTLEMITRSNELRESLPEDKDGIFFVDETIDTLGKIANHGFDDYIVGDLNLGGNYGRIKSVFLSKYMSYTGIMGIFIPFVSEPTINVDIPNQSLLSTISHEMAHQRGFAKEEEANFIAYKANINNPDERFQYSGYYLAMNYLMNEVYQESLDDYLILYDKLNDGVKRDMAFTGEYWTSRKGPVEKAATTLNDNYLKANNQVEGVRSYNGVVQLLLAEYMEQGVDVNKVR